MATASDLSVIVIPLIGHDVLADCLGRLPLDKVECIVVLRETMGSISSWQWRYPSVAFLDATTESVPLRRRRGLGAATGDVVGLIEDTSWPDESWCAAARSAFADAQTAAAGGPVRVAATLPSRCRALGWSEYGAFAPSRIARLTQADCSFGRPMTASRVPGNNMAFRRVELLQAMHEEDGGLVEGPVCGRLLAKGHRVVCQPGMLVTYSACDRHNASLATRLHHGRIYAAAQLRGRAWPSRLAYLVKATLLPIVLTARGMASMTGCGRLSARLPVLFWLALMETAWSVGEAVGALAGAGDSMNEWR